MTATATASLADTIQSVIATFKEPAAAGGGPSIAGVGIYDPTINKKAWFDMDLATAGF